MPEQIVLTRMNPATKPVETFEFGCGRSILYRVLGLGHIGCVNYYRKHVSILLQKLDMLESNRLRRSLVTPVS